MTHKPNVNQLGGAEGSWWVHGSYHWDIERELASRVSGCRSLLDVTETPSLSPLRGSARLLMKSLFTWRIKQHPSQGLSQKSQEGCWMVQLGWPDHPWTNRLSPGDSVLTGRPLVSLPATNHTGWPRFLWNNGSDGSLKELKRGKYKIELLDMTQKARKIW